MPVEMGDLVVPLSSGDCSSCIVTRAAFDERLLGVAFSNWEEFTASAAPSPGAPSELQGSMIFLDPLRIFTWLAAALLNMPIWVVVVTLSPLIGIPVVLLYGFCLRLVIIRWLEPEERLAHLAPLLWPLVPATVFASGLDLAMVITKDVLHVPDRAARVPALAVLLLACLPHLGLSIILFRPALGFSDPHRQPDPHRASLVLNIFVGTLASALASWTIIVDDSNLVGCWEVVLAMLSAVAIWVAGRLYLWPVHGASPELVSWLLNAGALALFADSCIWLTWRGTWKWVLFSLVMVILCILAAFFTRSFPFVLSAIGCFILAIRCSSAVHEILSALGAPSEVRTLASLVALGATGIVVLVVVIRAKQLQGEVTTRVRQLLQQHFGVSVAAGNLGDGLVGVEPSVANDDSAIMS